MEGSSFLKDNWPYVLVVVVIFLLLIVIFKIYNVNFNPIKNTQIDKVVTIEEFNTEPSLDPVPSNHGNNLHKIHKTCKSLSKHACKSASYCVLLDDKKCVGGSKKGPTYLTEDGKNVDYKYYHHKNECKGNCKN